MSDMSDRRDVLAGEIRSLVASTYAGDEFPDAREAFAFLRHFDANDLDALALAKSAHLRLVKQIRGDLESNGCTTLEFLELVDKLYTFLDGDFAYEDGAWTSTREPLHGAPSGAQSLRQTRSAGLGARHAASRRWLSAGQHPSMTLNEAQPDGRQLAL